MARDLDRDRSHARWRCRHRRGLARCDGSIGHERVVRGDVDVGNGRGIGPRHAVGYPHQGPLRRRDVLCVAPDRSAHHAVSLLPAADAVADRCDLPREHGAGGRRLGRRGAGALRCPADQLAAIRTRGTNGDDDLTDPGDGQRDIAQLARCVLGAANREPRLHRVLLLWHARRWVAASLARVTLGILNNGNPNPLVLQERVAELLARQHALGGVVTTQKAERGDRRREARVSRAALDRRPGG